MATEGNEAFVKFIDFETLRVTQTMVAGKETEVLDFLRGLALSPDGRLLLGTLVERNSSDLVLVEDFSLSWTVQLDTARSSEGAGSIAVPFTCLERALERVLHLRRSQTVGALGV